MDAFLGSIGEKLSQIFNPEVMGSKFAEWVSSLIVILIVLVVFYFIWRMVHVIVKPTLKRSNVDETTVVFIETLIKYSLLAIGLVTALGSAGIQISALLASLGIVGLTIGFAARDALSNIISGILIYLDRPFVIGDLVEIQDNYGRVEKITLRSTRVVTVDGRMLAVPNTQIINQTVISYTNFPHLRIDVDVTVGVSENIAKVREVLLNLVKNDPAYLDTPPPRVVVAQLNDYNVVVELQAWIKDERHHIEERFRLREMIFNTLNEAGIDMPFETIQVRPVDVHLKNQDV